MALPTIDELHSGLRALLLEQLRLEPVILGARLGMGSESLAKSIMRDHDGYMLDPVGVGADAQLIAEDLTLEVIGRTVGLPIQSLTGNDRAAQQGRVQLAEHYGSDLELALDAAAGMGSDETRTDWSIGRALGPNPRGELLAVRDAHRLTLDTLWELRDLANAGARILLLTTPEHRKQLHARDAPFYGSSAYIEMPTLPLVKWTQRLGGTFHPALLTELLRQTRYRTALTLEVLRRYESRPSVDIGEAWFRAIDARDTEARSVLTLARNIHELAPRLLVAIASGEAPYARSSERSDRIALALRRLRESDLVEQPEPRHWQIADPMLRAAIRRLRPGYVDIYPEPEYPFA